MKTILVPIDFSASAENSADYAAEIAALSKAKVILLHVCSAPVPVADVPITMIPIDELEKQSLTDLESLQKSLMVRHPGVEIESVVRTGFIIEEILLMEDEYKPELLVMGVTGKGRTSEIFGSNTTALIKKVECPVLAIPSGVRYSKPEKIALACDYSAIVPDKVTDRLKDFVKLFGSKLLIFDVLRPAEVITYQKAAAEVNLENSLSEIEHSIYYPSGNDIVNETNEFLERNNVGMVVMVPHNYTFIHKVFHSSKTKKMALYTKVPLLSIHE